jgi:hypothetical protein
MTTPLRRWFGMAVLSLFILAAPGCDSDSVVGPEALAGTYNLISVNGMSLPVILDEDEGEWGYYTETLVSGSLIIVPSGSAGGTWTASLVIEVDDNGEVDEFNEGSTGPYTISGNTITLEDDDEPITGTVSGDQISVVLSAEGMGALTLVFRK